MRINKDDVLSSIVLYFMESQRLSRKDFLKKVFKFYQQYNRGIGCRCIYLYEYLVGRIFNVNDILRGKQLNRLIVDLVDATGRYNIDLNHTYKKSVPMVTYESVYNYINKILLEYDTNKLKLKDKENYFHVLNHIIYLTEQGRKTRGKKIEIGTKDIDLLFTEKVTNIVHICEIKTKNNHSTDTKRDMVRRFYEKYAYAVYKFDIKSITQIKPMLLFFEGDKAYDFPGVANGECGILTGREFLELYTDYTADELVKKIEEVRDKKIYNIGEENPKIAYKKNLLTQIESITVLGNSCISKEPKTYLEFEQNLYEDGLIE